MSQTIVPNPANLEEAKLPSRDWILLPLIAVTTIASMMATAEVVSRVVWPANAFDRCYVSDGPDGSRFRPNCTSRTKAAEGPWVENSYNDCGYRTLEPCGPKPPGSIRVAVLGSSYSYGYLVPYDSAYTTLAGQMLTNECRRHVEFQNLGVVALPLGDVYGRMGEALALKPDVLLLSIDPFDVTAFTDFDPNASRVDSAQRLGKEDKENVHDWIHNDIVLPLKSSRAFMMLQHFMYQDPETYEKLYLLYGDAAGYARTPFSPLWQKRLSNLDVLLRKMSEKAHAVSVPMILLVGPSIFQAAMVNSPPRDGVDPSALPAEVTRIASKYDIRVINPLPAFAGRPKVMSLFYVVDGHTGPGGQRVVADVVNRELLSSNLSAFAGCGLK